VFGSAGAGDQIDQPFNPGALCSSEMSGARIRRLGVLSRQFRFGVLAGPAESRKHWVHGARAAKDLGYSIWLASDHFGGGYAPIPTIALAAEAISLRVGTLVLASDFRHPAAGRIER